MLSADDIRSLAKHVLEVLERHGVTPSPDSWFSRCLADLLADAEQLQTGETRIGETDAPRIRRNAGTIIFAQRVCLADSLGLLTSFGMHLKLLDLALPSQSARTTEVELSEKARQDTNKLLELVVGLAAAEKWRNTLLEPPAGSKEPNPDVLVTIGGELWAFACKVVICSSPDRQMAALHRLIKDGVNQIERSSALRGCVVVDLRNVFPHEVLRHRLSVRGPVPLAGAEQDQAVLDWFRGLGPRLREAKGEDATYISLGGRKAGSGFVGLIDTCADSARPGGIAFSPRTYCHYIRYGRVQHDAPREVTELMDALCGENADRFAGESSIPGFVEVRCPRR